MSIWPFWPVWPFLMGLAGVCAYWNWRAALAFATCVMLVRLLLYLELQYFLFWRMILYSVTAFVVIFFVDRIAGGFFALVSASLAAVMLGIIAHRTHVMASEITLVAGMIVSAYIGPSGGLHYPLLDIGWSASVSLAPESSEAAD